MLVDDPTVSVNHCCWCWTTINGSELETLHLRNCLSQPLKHKLQPTDTKKLVGLRVHHIMLVRRPIFDVKVRKLLRFVCSLLEACMM